MSEQKHQKGEHHHKPGCSHDHDHSHDGGKHDHTHDHGHSHGHGHLHHHHHHASGRLGVAFALNLSFAVIELIGGILTNSVAILSDAIHDFGDAVAIGFAWGLERASNRSGSPKFSYGFRRLSILSAVLTSTILLAGSIAVIIFSVPRFFEPVVPHANGMIALAILGLAVNGYAAWKTSAGTSLNEKAITWHLIEDVMGWALVLIGALVVKLTNWSWVDPLLAIILAVWVIKNVYGILLSAVQIFLQGTPDSIDIPKIEMSLSKIPGVKEVHHTHVWTLDGAQHILTTHIVTELVSLADIAELKVKIKNDLKDKYEIAEATLEIEALGEDCNPPVH
jgi:cobalt-zinc-cadmium efflux system protein